MSAIIIIGINHCPANSFPFKQRLSQRRPLHDLVAATNAFQFMGVQIDKGPHASCNAGAATCGAAIDVPEMVSVAFGPSIQATKVGDEMKRMEGRKCIFPSHDYFDA
jgi:hypothetical protein